jgi:hypothetical protein
MTNPETQAATLPLNKVVAVFLLALGGYLAVGPLVGLLILSPFFSFDYQLILDMLTFPEQYPHSRLVILIYQGFAQIVGFIAIPFFYFRYIGFDMGSHVFRINQNFNQLLVLTGAVVIVFMGVNTLFIEWNEAIKFPEWLEGFEQWASSMEEGTQKMLTYLISFDSFFEFFIGLIVIAMIPAIGEELVFRGILQHQIIRHFHLPHLAIWSSAIIFSAIHLQFYGFVPRMLLGAVFGYLFYWSGSLWVPFWAHFLHNGFTLSMTYLYRQGMITYNIEDPENSFSWLSFSVSLVVFIFLMIYFRRKTIN